MEREFEIYKIDESTLGKDDVIILKINNYNVTPKELRTRIAKKVIEKFKDHKVLVLPDFADISIIKQK